MEFATKYGLEIRRVIAENVDETPEALELPYLGEAEAIVIDGGDWTGESCLAAQEKMAAFAERGGFGRATVTYRLKDWGVSRQRYLGDADPDGYCERGHVGGPGGAGVEPGGVVPATGECVACAAAGAGRDHAAGWIAAR